MVTYCAVSNCKVTYSKSGPSLHAVPTDPVIRKKWLKNIKRSSFMPTSKVCSKHFTPDCFVHNGWASIKQLRKDAVPTIFEANETEPTVRVKKVTKKRVAGTVEKMALRQRTTRSKTSCPASSVVCERVNKVQQDKSSNDTTNNCLYGDQMAVTGDKMPQFVDIQPRPEILIFQPVTINTIHLQPEGGCTFLDGYETHIQISSIKTEEVDPLGASQVCNLAVEENNDKQLEVHREETHSTAAETQLKFCRTCGAHQNPLVDIYSNEGTSKNLSEKINKHLPIKVCVEDCLPLSLCVTCVELLEACSLIRESSQLQDDLLRNNLTQQTSACAFSEEQVSSPAAPPREEVSDDDQRESAETEPLVDKPGTSSRQATKRRNGATSTSHVDSNSARPKKRQKRGKRGFVLRIAEKHENNEVLSYDAMEKKLLAEIAANDATAVPQMKPLRCKECDESFFDECLYNVHVKHHEIKKMIMIYKCKSCGEKFQSFYLLTTHKKSEHPIGNIHVCEHCGKQFRRKDNLESHINYRHKSELPYLCHLCSKSFALIHDLRFHIKNHANITCNICNKTFRYPENLKMHERAHKKSGTSCKQTLETTLCPICKLNFKNNQFLEHHILFKHPESSIINKLSIKLHEKKFTCTYCGASYTSKSVLMNHINTHTKNKTYKCKYCDKISYNFLSIRSHEKSHSNVRPFACTFCDMTFKLRYGLNVHLRTHTGEKPYKCDICGTAFAQSSDLKRHILRHNGGGPVRPPRKKLRCEECGGIFTSSKRLEEHQCGGGEGEGDFLSNVICDGRSVWQ